MGMGETPKRRPGRPKGSKSKKASTDAEFITERPAHFVEAGGKTITAWVEGLAVAKKQIRKEFKYDATLPDKHVFELASVGHELLDGFEDPVLARDKNFREKIAEARAKGTKATKENALTRAEKVLAKNAVLLSVIGSKDVPSPVKAAEIICDQWESVSQGQRFDGEPVSLTFRGDGGPIPGTRTVANWIRDYRKINL